MSNKDRIKTVLLYGIFSCYIILLIKILLLSRVSSFESLDLFKLFDSNRTIRRPINLIPFHSITASISNSYESFRSFALGNVVGNIILFIPLGIYLSLFRMDKRIFNNLILVSLVSTIVETIQWGLGIGVFDIDDIILNSFGGWLGIVIYKVLCLLLHDEKKVSSVVTIQSAFIGIPVTFYLLFMVKMRF